MVVKNEGVEGREGGGKSWFTKTRKRGKIDGKGRKKLIGGLVGLDEAKKKK